MARMMSSSVGPKRNMGHSLNLDSWCVSRGAYSVLRVHHLRNTQYGIRDSLYGLHLFHLHHAVIEHRRAASHIAETGVAEDGVELHGAVSHERDGAAGMGLKVIMCRS